MIVVADTSPFFVLVQIELVDLLHDLFAEVWIPPAVEAELHRAKYESVRQFIANAPAWLSVRTPTTLEVIPEIDTGETAAISLALELHSELLLMDDFAGRQAARVRGLVVTGTLAVLERASQAKLIDLEDAFRRVRATDFHVTEKLLQEILNRNCKTHP